MDADVETREGRLRMEPLPNWPLLMPTPLAARYLSLDENRRIDQSPGRAGGGRSISVPHCVV
jgi:hypothetical protein